MTDDDIIAYLAGQDAPVDSIGSGDQAELDDLRALLADPTLWAEPSPDLEDRVTAAISQAASTSGQPRLGPADPTGTGRDRSTRRKVLVALAGLAAAAAIAVAVAVGVSAGGAKPVRFQAALAGTALAPHASAQVSMTQTLSGWRITLHGSGLPRLDNGLYYEAWLKNPAGILVPIGTFNQANSVTLWSGVAPTEFPTMTVTRQQANGDPVSSGQRVLTGLAVRTR